VKLILYLLRYVSHPWRHLPFWRHTRSCEVLTNKHYWQSQLNPKNIPLRWFCVLAPYTLEFLLFHFLTTNFQEMTEFSLWPRNPKNFPSINTTWPNSFTPLCGLSVDLLTRASNRHLLHALVPFSTATFRNYPTAPKSSPSITQNLIAWPQSFHPSHGLLCPWARLKPYMLLSTHEYKWAPVIIAGDRGVPTFLLPNSSK
jgi:hypothetical protein